MSKRTWSEFYVLDPKPIGWGGQAEVVRGVDRKTGAEVAIKRLVTITPEGTARMKREVEVQRHLSHPRVMPVHRHSARYSWYSMPLARRTLKDLRPPLPESDLLEVASAAIEALVAAHQHRYIHRDITPSNILDIGSDVAHWVIGDWGLVRRHGLTTATRTQPGEFGTAGFAAPETWSDAHAADHRADIYSLGRVIAWALTGVALVPNVPFIPDGPWAGFVRATTAMRPENRPQTAVAVLELLKALAAPPPAQRPSRIPPEVVASIKLQATASFPDDFSTRKYVIDREVEAWYKLDSLEIHDIPSDVMAAITLQTAEEHPEDYSTRLYVVEREAEAWRALQALDLPAPTEVLERIVAKARHDFPRDFSTQLYVIQREADAWRDLQG